MHIFLSYAKKDTYNLAMQLDTEINALRGVTCWVDHDLTPGHSWAREIEREIERCDLMIALISPDVNRDQDGDKGLSFVINEISYAQSRNKTIVPVLAKHTAIPIEISAVQHIDITADVDRGKTRLLAHIRQEAKSHKQQALTSHDADLQQQRPRWIYGTGVVVLILIVGIIVGLMNGLSGDEKPQKMNTSTATALSIGFAPVISNDDWEAVIHKFNGVEMALVPVGCFMMGSEDGDANEQPVDKICFDEPFWIDKTEVTRALYQECIVLDECETPTSNAYSSEDNHPINNVAWFQVKQYCEWRDSRLPTEAEWEYAARGPGSWVYPWGDNWDPNRLNWGDTNVTFPVGSFPLGASWVGAMDMAGNVWEWTSTIYADYSKDGRENPNDTNSTRVLRGGAATSTAYAVRATYRNETDPTREYFSYGFRCAQSFN